MLCIPPLPSWKVMIRLETAASHAAADFHGCTCNLVYFLQNTWGNHMEWKCDVELFATDTHSSISLLESNSWRLQEILPWFIIMTEQVVWVWGWNVFNRTLNKFICPTSGRLHPAGPKDQTCSVQVKMWGNQWTDLSLLFLGVGVRGSSRGSSSCVVDASSWIDSQWFVSPLSGW